MTQHIRGARSQRRRLELGSRVITARAMSCLARTVSSVRSSGPAGPVHPVRPRGFVRPRSAVPRPRANASEHDTTSNLASVLPLEAREDYRELAREDEDDARFLDAAPRDLFELLGVDADADGSDVQSAFR